jgi:hypothetical protein
VSENRRYGPIARTLIGGEDEAEYVDAFLFGVQRTCPRVKAVSKVSDLEGVGIDVFVIKDLTARSAPRQR